MLAVHVNCECNLAGGQAGCFATSSAKGTDLHAVPFGGLYRGFGGGACWCPLEDGLTAFSPANSLRDL
jgi:hypothetical protein